MYSLKNVKFHYFGNINLLFGVVVTVIEKLKYLILKDNMELSNYDNKKFDK